MCTPYFVRPVRMSWITLGLPGLRLSSELTELSTTASQPGESHNSDTGRQPEDDAHLNGITDTVEAVHILDKTGIKLQPYHQGDDCRGNGFPDHPRCVPPVQFVSGTAGYTT
ncbi:hypothetical protein GCM10020255_027410 [Rhodococcus baikonurensis]